MSGPKRCWKRSMKWGMGFLLSALVAAQGVVTAKSMYIYINEKGSSVITDTLDHVPKKYRATVKVFEMPDEEGTLRLEAGDSQASTHGYGSRWLALAFEKFPTIRVDTPSVMLAGGGLLVFVSFATMMFSRNMAVKFAMKWLLLCAIVATSYGWYFSVMGLGGSLGVTGRGEQGRQTLLERVREDTQEIEAIQHKKRMDIENILEGDQAPAKKRKP